MFIWFALGFIGLIFVCYKLAELTALAWILPALFILYLVGRLGAKLALMQSFNQLKHLAKGTIIGVLWLLGWLILNPALDDRLLHTPVEIEGKIIGLPEITSARNTKTQKFELQIIQIKDINNSAKSDINSKFYSFLTAPKVRLSCFNCEQEFAPNQIWLFKAKLKSIHGSVNPGGFDYEAWAHSNGIKASGYILEPETASLLRASFGLENLRYQFANQLAPLFAEREFAGIYSALLFAGKEKVTDEQWEILQKTGTIHLMAISGLHIGLVGGIGFLFGSLLWRLPIKRFEVYPVQWFGVGFALIFMTLYSILAGFSIPTQRAWIMGLVLLVFLLLRRKLQVWPMLLLAGVLVVAWNPPSVLAQGFWLSFLAVAAIFIWLNTGWAKHLNWWQNLIALQLVISVALMPALWWFYQQVPVYSLTANLLAVPFVSFLGLPLLLLIALLNLLVPLQSGLVVPIIDWLLSLSDWLWHQVWWVLAAIANWDFGYWTLAPRSWLQVFLVYWLVFGWLVWLIQRKYQRKLLEITGKNQLKNQTDQQKDIKSPQPDLVVSLIISSCSLSLAIGIWLYQPTKPQLANNQARINLLDVGQGLSLVVETKNHLLVYDTGPKYSNRFNGATIAITPFLRHQGWQKIDHLMISHADLDHAGGTENLLKNWQVLAKTSGEPSRLNKLLDLTENEFQTCHSLKPWVWDGVKFEVLSAKQFNPTQANDFSCGLKISLAHENIQTSPAFIITGDLSSPYEDGLLNFPPLKNQTAQVLVAGHHGSKFSTSSFWLKNLQPEYLLFSAGYKNSYGFPSKEVVKRAEEQKIKMLNTACSGAISFRLNETGLRVENQARQNQKRWFHQACKD